MITILGENIRLIRPSRTKQHTAKDAWQGAKSAGRKTIKLTYRMKQRIARELGYELADVVDTVRAQRDTVREAK